MADPQRQPVQATVESDRAESGGAFQAERALKGPGATEEISPNAVNAKEQNSRAYPTG
jgi:hypothetical protein